MTLWTKSELQLHPQEDPAIHQAITWIRTGTRPNQQEISHLSPEVGSLWSQFSRLKLENDLLFREFESEDGASTFLQSCLPRKLVPEVLELLHNTPTTGHLRVHKGGMAT